MLRPFLPKLPPPSSSAAASPEPPSLLSLLRRCGDLKRLRGTHGFMVPRGLDRDNVLLGHFIGRCFSLGLSDYAMAVFARSARPDVYLYNAVIRALPDAGSAEMAVRLFGGIRASGLRPDSYSLPFALRAAVRLSAVGIGRQIHGQSVGIGLDSDAHVATALVRMYCSGGCISDARKVFDGLSSGSAALWNAMIAGYAKAGCLESARELFERMPERNLITWTAVIGGYAQWNRPGEAIEVFKRMLLEGIEPDEVSMLAALSACAQLGALALGEWIDSYIDRHGLNRTVQLNNALIDTFAKSGNIRKARQVFEGMMERTVVSWTTMIAGLAVHGMGREALEMFSGMERAKIKPNEITFTAVLSACSHSGMVKLGRGFFTVMHSRYGIDPKIEQYGCMVDLLGRGGYLQEAEQLVKSMPFEANAAIWGSLLAASNVYGDPDLGEQALQHLMRLEPENSGNFSLLSNTYAGLGRWNESGSIRKTMRAIGTEKMPGKSSIELNNKVHEFAAEDLSNHPADVINEVLCTIDGQMRAEGGPDEFT
ncbi:hypothetical protein ACJRO7_004659 [Eucalyptus globulus]|uniref:Pentatricopeptide repeat-containing protein n=1 Tax=Eucalyptus globulus TaxID=34317 RepID=A0ABD3IZI8_EUCGL